MNIDFLEQRPLQDGFLAQLGPIWTPKRLPKGSPKRAPNGVRNRFELKAAKSQNSQDVSRKNLNFEAPGAHFGSRNGVRNGVQNGISMLTALESLLRASWSALGALRSRKNYVERLLAAPRGMPRDVLAILGAKVLPKGTPRGSEIEFRRRLELEMAKPRKLARYLTEIIDF